MTSAGAAAEDITVAILAGGAARRLRGRDKGLIRVLERPLVAWALEALDLAPGQACLIVANRNLDEYARFAATIADRDPAAFVGPLGGVAAALATCTTAWLYSVPVDCVKPRPEILGALRRASLNCAADVFVAHDGKRRQPLFALYRSALASSAAEAVACGAGVMCWQNSLDTREVDLRGLPDDAWLNLNTPEDFAWMTKRMKRDG